ncbi:MAG TPA: hypothetical protein VJQ83_04240 [Tepidiformaceae bacterium]|nr:hypothetical protein [Tepidiformaceae bacterium]
MSKLSKKITRIQRREGGGFGFGAAHREQPRAMLLGVFAADAAAVGTAATAGADVVVVRGKDAAKAIQAAAAKDATVGAWVDSLDSATGDALHAAGCDFVVSGLGSTDATAVDTDRMGQVIVQEGALDDTTLRALGPLGLDCIFVNHNAGPMTLLQQLELVRVASFASTPLMVTVAADAGLAELRVLRDSGVAVVVAPAGTSEEALSALGERLRQIPTSKRGRENGREMAIVPSTAGHHDEEEDEPEEI